MENLYLDQTLLTEAKRLADKMHERSISLYLTGLAASGKSAVAAIVSQLTGIPIVDTGLPFRLATYICQNIPAAAEDLKLFDHIIKAHTIKAISGKYHLFSGSEDITDRLRTQEIDLNVPRIAGDIRLRERVLNFLRSTTNAPAIVAARGATEPLTSGHILQIELKAHLNTRAFRRASQENLPKDMVRRSIRERDERDMRGASRYPSSDAVDSTQLTLDETVACVIKKANERIERLNAFKTFRRVPFPEETSIDNPLLKKAWDSIQQYVTELEQNYSVPKGHSKGRYLLHLSRFSARELFGDSTTELCEWPPGLFPENVNTDSLAPNIDLLKAEAKRIVLERHQSLESFFSNTRLPRSIIEGGILTRVRRTGAKLIVENDNGEVIDRLDVRDASKELGIAVEEFLHYLGIARRDTTHRLVLVEQSTDLPVLYVSFSSNSRKYTEPLLSAFGLRMEEVAVAARGYGWLRCPQNGMGLFLRMACDRVGKDFPHLKAILTDINPNWGFSGNSFREAGFIDVGLKHAPTSFVGDEYSSRRGLEDLKGRKAATLHRLSLVPTLIMLKPINQDQNLLASKIKDFVKDGLFLIPQTLYNKE